MSTDVAGSTAYKTARTQAPGADGLGDGSGLAGEPAWLGVFRSFFGNFPLMLMGHIASEMMEEDALPEVSVWKALGDEIIFTAQPQSPEETTSLVRAFFQAMTNYEREYLTLLPLRLKGSIWIAEFPSPNIEIELPEVSGGGGPMIDFIGPGVDLGFRIGKFARPSAVVLSLEVVEIVLSARNCDSLTFTLVGRGELKGVLFGRPYPIVWARPTESEFEFLPWEIEDCPLTRTAMTEPPASAETLQTLIDDVRLYLRKMWGIESRPLTFP